MQMEICITKFIYICFFSESGQLFHLLSGVWCFECVYNNNNNIFELINIWWNFYCYQHIDMIIMYIFKFKWAANARK